MNKSFPFALILSIFSIITSCYKPKSKKDVPQKEDVYQETYINEEKIVDEDPLVQSDKYHLGFEKRKISYLYPYQPTIFKEMPRIDINTPDNKNDFLTKLLTREQKNLEPYTDMTFTLSNCEDKYKMNNVPGKIRQSGNISLRRPKKKFNIKFENKQSLLGLNNSHKFKNWSLNCTFIDYSCLRDLTAFYLGKNIFSLNNLYTSTSTPVVVYFNNSYSGTYLLQEKQEVNNNRVDIDDVKDRTPKGEYQGTDIGYFIEYDGYSMDPVEGDDPVFTIDYHNNAPLKTFSGVTVYQTDISYNSRDDFRMLNSFAVKSKIYSNEQLSFIGNFVDKTYDLIYEAIYNKKYYVFDESYANLIEKPNSNAFDVINSVVDIQSFVDMFLLNEIFCNLDAYWSSIFMQVDFSSKGDKKLKFTGIWDQDNAMGSSGFNTYPLDNVIGFYTAENIPYKNAWFLLLIHEKWFMDMVKSKWKELIEHGVLYNTLHYVDEFKITYNYEYKRNFNKWNSVAEITSPRPTYAKADSYDSACDYLFKFLARRYNNLNKIIGDYTKLFTY